MSYRRWNPGCPCCDVEPEALSCNQIYPYVAWHSGIAPEHHCFGLYIGSGNTFADQNTVLLTHYSDYIYRRPSISGIQVEMTLSPTGIYKYIYANRYWQYYRKIDSILLTHGSGVLYYEFQKYSGTDTNIYDIDIRDTLLYDRDISSYTNCPSYIDLYNDNDGSLGAPYVARPSGFVLTTIFTSKIHSYDYIHYNDRTNIKYFISLSGFPGTCVDINRAATLGFRNNNPGSYYSGGGSGVAYNFDSHWIPGLYESQISLFTGSLYSYRHAASGASLYYTPLGTRRWSDYPKYKWDRETNTTVLMLGAESESFTQVSYDGASNGIFYNPLPGTHPGSGILSYLSYRLTGATTPTSVGVIWVQTGTTPCLDVFEPLVTPNCFNKGPIREPFTINCSPGGYLYEINEMRS